MNYTDMINALRNASLFDLYRLTIAIHHELENPERIHQVRQSFKIGDQVSYFSKEHNTLIEAIVLKKNTKNVLVKNVHDQKTWSIQYYLLNITGANVNIQSDKLSKSNLSVGDCVGFNHDGSQIIGLVLRLNHKTVSLITKDYRRWRVSYKLLFKVIDAELATMFDLRQLRQWAKKELTFQE